MTLQVEFSESASVLQVDFEAAQTFAVDFGEIHEVSNEEIPTYSGPYAVRPSLEPQTLETSGKLMEDNVQIEEIPIYVVSNNSGGTTVTIGG